MNNPGNVPEPQDARWVIAQQEPCTYAQIDALTKIMFDEGIKPAEFFGNGFTRITELSKWAAHWAINYLQDARKAFYLRQEQQDRAAEFEQTVKSNIAEFFYAKNPELRWRKW